MNFVSTMATLIGRGTVTRFRQATGRPAPTRALTVTVTRRCNSRCTMCNIWRLGFEEEELSAEVIAGFLSSPALNRLVELDLTGGEPLLREDLPELIGRVARRKAQNLRSLQTVALATNGLLPKWTERGARSILAAVGGRFELAMICSLDALDTTHDSIRGLSGAYGRARETIARLQALKRRHPAFQLGIKTTILPANVDQIDILADFARREGLFHILSPVLFTPERFRNLGKRDQLDLLPRFRQRLIDHYSRPPASDHYYSHVVTEVLMRGRRTAPCTAGLDHFFVEGDGRIFPCPVIPEPLGDVRTDTVEDLSASPVRAEAARFAGRSEPCRHCLEPGCVRFSQPGEGFHFLRFALQKRSRRRFRTALREEALSKYFG